MRISQQGIELIKSFEGLRLTAYKAVPTEKYYTIGYGHYGPDVLPNMHISERVAEETLKSDLKKYEDAVNYFRRRFTQGQFDALVSFAYNCGVGNLRKLVTGRSINEIGEKILLYNKAGGKVLKGLQRRREAERNLYLS